MSPNRQKLSSTLANSLYIQARDGGLMNSKFETPKWGYLVRIETGPTFPNLVSVMPSQVAKFIWQNLGQIPHLICYFSAHTDKETGEVKFNLMEQCATLSYAKGLAKKSGVNTIWDVKGERDIAV